MSFIVSWVDKANDETGYRVFRNGEAVAELPANSTVLYGYNNGNHKRERGLLRAGLRSIRLSQHLDHANELLAKY